MPGVVRALAFALALSGVDPPIALPPWPLSPDGELVAVRGEAPLEAEGARVERQAPRLWRVVPLQGRESVLLRAGPDQITAPVGPPTGAISIAFDPAEPVKGRDAQVLITFDVRGAGGQPLDSSQAPVIVPSTGKLGPVVRGGSVGRFEAIWTPAGTLEPEVLGIVALVPRCPLCATPLAAGEARLPIAAAIDLPGKSDPGVDTWVEIAGRSWGPVRADAEGRFVVPVVVPPGTRWGNASSQSAIGNERKTRIDLRVSEAPGLVCALWPERVPADGATSAGLTCTAWTAAGALLDPHPLRGVSVRGQLSEPAGAGGLWSMRYRPPVGVAGVDQISVTLGAAPDVHEELIVGLATGEPMAIDWSVTGEPLVAGSRVPVTAHVRDRWGGVLGEAGADDGSVVDGTLQVRAELTGGAQQVSLAFALPPGGPPAMLSVHRVEQDWVAVARDAGGRPVDGVTLDFGGGARVTTDRAGEARSRATGGSETVVGPAGLRAIGWADAPAAVPARAVARLVRVALRPPETVDVAATVDGRWIRWRVLSPTGATLSRRLVTAASDTVELGPSEPDGDAGRCAVRGGKGTVTITDVESGVAALLEIR